MIETIASLCLGLGLAASAGFRVFLPLLCLSIASHFGLVPLGESWQWVGTTTAIIAFSFATMLEILAFYIPWVDNALDTVAIPTAAIAGTAVMASTAVDIDPLWGWALAIIAGGGTATAIKSSNAATRLASSTTTGGVANPIVNTAETLFSASLSLLSIYLWPVAAILTILLLVAVFFFWKFAKKKLFRKKQTT